ncbi:hypothetical protein ACOJUR_10755 [Alicyclobacillus tolerans]
MEYFYNLERVAQEMRNGQYWFAVDGDMVVGAGGVGVRRKGK